MKLTVIWLDYQHWTNYIKRQFNWKLILFSQPAVFMLIMKTQVSSRLILTLEWSHFFKEESKDTIKKCNSSSTPKPDHISWHYFWWTTTNVYWILSILLMYASTFVFSHHTLKDLLPLSSQNLTKLFTILQRLFNQLFFSTCLENLLKKLLVKDYKSNLSPPTLFILINLEVWNNSLPQI